MSLQIMMKKLILGGLLFIHSCYSFTIPSTSTKVFTNKNCALSIINNNKLLIYNKHRISPLMIKLDDDFDVDFDFDFDFNIDNYLVLLLIFSTIKNFLLLLIIIKYYSLIF
jgi:hypothetical protein